MFYYPQNYGQTVLIAVPTVFVFLATLAVSARLWAKRKARNPVTLDDLMAIFGLVCLYGLYISVILNVTIGAGGTTDVQVTPVILRVFLQTTAAKFEFWCTSVTAIQLAIIFFYLRLFGVKRWFRNTCYATIAVVVGWWVSTFVSELLACVPFTKLWTHGEQGICFDDPLFCTTTGLIHVVLDFWILALPTPVIWQLQRSRTSRTLLTMLFAAGVFASVCSTLRIACLISFGSPGGSKLAGYLPEMFEALEPAVGLICISVPTLQPVASHVSRSRMGSSIRRLLTWTGSKRSSDISFNSDPNRKRSANSLPDHNTTTVESNRERFERRDRVL